MPRLYDNVSMGFLFEDQETSMRAIRYFFKNANASMKGYKHHYYRYSTGNIEFHMAFDIFNDHVEFKSLNVHYGNLTVWKMKVKAVIDRNYDDYVLAICSDEDDLGFYPICIINPDVLPRIGEGTKIPAQIAAFPVSFQCFKTEEDFYKICPEWNGVPGSKEKNVGKIGIANGVISPVQFLLNHQIRKDDSDVKNEDCSNDNIVLIRGIIKSIYVYTLTFLGMDEKYFGITINTQMGDLEFYLSKEQIGDEKLAVGDIFLTDCIISADVGILSYENGAMADENHLLQLCRDFQETNDYSRIQNWIADDCIYTSEWADNGVLSGKEEIIKHLKTVCETRISRKIRSWVRIAHITSINEPVDDTIKHLVGDKCVVLSDEKEENYVCMTFIKLNEENKISRFEVVRDGRYRFAFPAEELTTEVQKN